MTKKRIAKKRTARSGQQWKTVRGAQLDTLDLVCEEWTGKGWTVFAILGPFGDGFAVVFNRLLVL